MTIASMTAYAREAQQGPWGELVWELRTVNHRFLDISLRLPEMLNPLEMQVREYLQASLQRGKIMASLQYNPGEQTPFQLAINQALLHQLVLIADHVDQQFDEVHVDFLQLLKWPSMLTTTEQNTDVLIQSVLTTLNAAIQDLVVSRQREGKKLHDFIEKRLAEILRHISLIKVQIPKAEIAQRERLLQRVSELNFEIDPQRVQQEILFYLQKIDVAEEMQRLEMHVMEVKRVISAGGVVGRRLDFLVQEMQRETNTLGTKANDMLIQQVSVELKVLIEQIREQVQNIE